MYMTWVGVVTLILCGWSSAQSSSITVNLDTAPIVHKDQDTFTLNLTVPRVSQVVFRSTTNKIVDINKKCDEGDSEFTCTLELDDGGNITLTFGSSEPATLLRPLRVTVYIEDDYEFGCSTYQFPAQLNKLVDMTRNLTCVPVFVNSSQSASAVAWCRSSSPSGENAMEIDYSEVTPREVDGIVNASLMFKTAGKKNAAYYFPVPVNDTNSTSSLCSYYFPMTNTSSSLSNSSYSSPVSNTSSIAPILVTYQPIITSRIVEFSDDLYIDPNVPVNHPFDCEVESFPEARMIWRFRSTSSDTQNCTLASTMDMICPNNVNASVIRDDNGVAVAYRLTIENVDYANSGFYWCFPENDAFLVDVTVSGNARRYRLRVKDHLRPLWPAIGIIGVFILMALFIAFSALWDRFYPKGPRADKLLKSTDSHGRPFSVVSNSSGSPDAVSAQLTDGHLHLRRISSARVQLLEETGNN